MVHKGSKLINHPLMGSIEPNVTPYRSILRVRWRVFNWEEVK